MKWLVAVAVIVTASVRVHADSLRFDLSYVSGELRGSTVTFHARFVGEVTGPAFDMSARTVTLPVKAVATAVTVQTPDGIHRLGLTATDPARDAFTAISGRPGPAKRWAFLVEARADMLDISIAAPQPATFTMDIEIQMPTCYSRDARYVSVPLEWKRVLSPRLRTRTGRVQQLALACRGQTEVDADELWVGFPRAELAHKPSGADRVGADAARIDLGDAHIARLEVAISSKLGDVPDDLATAILVDSSRSMSGAQFEAQRELVKAYARAAGNTQVQIISVARTARAMLPSWSNARAASARIDRELRALAPRNGSNIDAGLVEAARWLGQTSGTKRVLIVTDEVVPVRLYAAFDNLSALLPPGTLVHVAAVDEFSELARMKGFAHQLAESTGGIEVRAGVPEEGKSLDATMLLRPISIDDLHITAPGWKQFSQTLASTCDASLAEGMGCVWWGEGDAIAGPVAVEGSIWGGRFSRVLGPDSTRDVELARELASMAILDERASERVQKMMRAANTAFSFFAEWGGAGGYDLGGFGITGGECCGRHGRSVGVPRVTIGQPGLGKTLPKLDFTAQLVGVVPRCELGDAHVEAFVETTLHEIVDVRVIAPPDKVKCVEDTIWETSLNVQPTLLRASSRVVLVE